MSYDDDKNQHLALKIFGGCVAVFIMIGAFSLLNAGCDFAGGAVDNGVQVAKKEFYPDALLRKYEWFKEASAALDAKAADITVYDQRLKDLKGAYGNAPRSQWARDDREQYSVWQSEEAGVKASFNQLASEYNAEMVKFNWRFTNVGDLPQGGKPLPREYKPYITE